MRRRSRRTRCSRQGLELRPADDGRLPRRARAAAAADPGHVQAPVREKPPPLVPRRLRYEIPSGSAPRGEVWNAGRGRVRAAAERARGGGVAAVAISFLHAYANPAHERARPRSCATSSARTPTSPARPRSSPRSASTSARARRWSTPTSAGRRALSPLARGAPADAGVAAPLQVMQSSGGVMSAAARRPGSPRTWSSRARPPEWSSLRLSRSRHRHPQPDLLDMGGTTAKAAILEDGEPVKTSRVRSGRRDQPRAAA